MEILVGLGVIVAVFIGGIAFEARYGKAATKLVASQEQREQNFINGVRVAIRNEFMAAKTVAADVKKAV